MQEIGAFEAKNKLAALLDRVEEGEEIVITRHGRAVARLVPNIEPVDRSKARAAARRIRASPKAKSRSFQLGGIESGPDAGRP
jgi:prevent-host-death family protein